MSDGADALVVLGELADQREHTRIVAEIFRGAPTQDEDCRKLPRGYGSDRHIGLNTVALPLDVSLPARLRVVKDHVQPPSRLRGHDRLPIRFFKAVVRVKRFVAVSGVA